MSFVETPDNNQESEKMGDLKSPLAHSSALLPTAQSDDNMWHRKLLTAKRLLLSNLEHLGKRLRWARLGELNDLAAQIQDIECSFDDFKARVSKNLSNPDLKAELIDDVIVKLKQCRSQYDTALRKLLGERDAADDCSNSGHELGPEDSVSQVTESRSNVTTTSSKILAHQIEIDRKRAELNAAHTRDLAKVKAKAKAKAAASAAASAAAAAEAEAEAEAAEAEARFRMEEAKLEAEEKLSALSNRGSSVAASRHTYSKYRKAAHAKSANVVGFNLNQKLNDNHIQNKDRFVHDSPAGAWGGFFGAGSATAGETKPKIPVVSRRLGPPMVPADGLREHKSVNPVTHGGSVFEAYLERQGRNEYINLAAQIGYDGRNIAYVFYENQIRKLMNETPCDERRLEVLRASCVGQPREMVNLFLAPMKSISTSQRIEKALDRLRQRYGVSGGLTTEPQIIDIRHGTKVVFNTGSLKAFNEDLNTLEVFAYAHDEIEKLSGQLLLDVAGRLPGVLKRRYLDYLTQRGLNLNRPGFDSLRKFVVHELSVMTSDYAQSFFKSDEKEKPRADSGGSRGPVRVRQVAVESNQTPDAQTNPRATESQNNLQSRNQKPPPLCFVCHDSVSRHFLGECQTFKNLSNDRKKRTVTDAGRCLNCLSLGHVVRNCMFPSKCRRCGPKPTNKHAGVLHEFYFQSRSVNDGAAEIEKSRGPVSERRASEPPNNDDQVLVSRKTIPVKNNNVLLRTSAVRVVNPHTGKSTLVYAQHDTASQATLVSERLINELNLKVDTNHSISIRTLAQQATRSVGLVEFNLQSLSTDETFEIKNALAVPEFMNDEGALPHAVNVEQLEHFKGVKIPVLSNRKSIDILIGQTDKLLLAVLEEREGPHPDAPNYILTRLGPIASGGRSGVGSNRPQSLKVRVKENVAVECNNCEQLKKEVVELNESVRNYEIENEELQHSKNDEAVRQLVEANVKVKNDRYEVPVPLKPDVVATLPNNYSNALNRTLNLRRNALKNAKLQGMLTETFKEMISEKWITPVYDGTPEDDGCWYLPFFVTNQDKPRVVFDGAAKFEGAALNDAVLPGSNLLNGLVDVLIRFRVGRYACMADLSKCFFQVAMPENQQNLFRLVWFENNDVNEGKIQLFKFTRHVWGINSSPFVALFAIEKLINENPTDAGPLTLTAIENNRYMDDLLLASDSLSDLQTVARESVTLFKSRGFRLRKWVASSNAKTVLNDVPKCDLGSNIREIDLGSEPMPDSKALGLVWDVENDRLRVLSKRKLQNVSTRREMLSAIAGQFDPLGTLSPLLLEGKLILQEVATSGIDWDDKLPDNILNDWRKWVSCMESFADPSIPRCCFPNGPLIESTDNVVHQLHGFCDASNRAFSCVVYLRRMVNGCSSVAFIQGKVKVVLVTQTNWVISRKELEAARMCSELMQSVSNSLQHLDCSLHLKMDC